MLKSKPFSYLLEGKDHYFYVDNVLPSATCKEALDCLENYIESGVIFRNVNLGTFSVYNIHNVELHLKRDALKREINMYFKTPRGDIVCISPYNVVERIKGLEIIKDI